MSLQSVQVASRHRPHELPQHIFQNTSSCFSWHSDSAFSHVIRFWCILFMCSHIPSSVKMNKSVLSLLWKALCDSSSDFVQFVDSSFQRNLHKSCLTHGGNCSGCWNCSLPNHKHPSEWHEEPLWRQRSTFCEPSSHIITLLIMCVCVCVCNCTDSLLKGMEICTWQRISVLSSWKCDWWLIHQAFQCYSAMCDVSILSWYKCTDWCLHCISLCEMLHTLSACVPWDFSPPVWATYDLCRKPPWKMWNKPFA